MQIHHDVARCKTLAQSDTVSVEVVNYRQGAPQLLCMEPRRPLLDGLALAVSNM